MSGIIYDWRGGWSGNGDGDGGYGREIIYCASDDGRRHTCPVNTGGVVRLVTQKSGSACVQGRTWGFNVTAFGWIAAAAPISKSAVVEAMGPTAVTTTEVITTATSEKV